MDVKQQDAAVSGGEGRQVVSGFTRVAIRRLSIGNIDNDRWEGIAMRCDPITENCFGFAERLAHRCTVVGFRLQPNWEPNAFLNDPSSTVIDLLRSLFNSQWGVGDLTDRPQF